MDKGTIHAAARKALIAANASYHAWPAQRQEHFRATMDDEAQNRVAAVLLKDLLGIECTAENASAIWHDQPDSKLNILNWARLLTTGIGDDYLYLNESMQEHVSLLDFQTLHDYDYNDHLYQERANKKEFKDYTPGDYYAFRFSCWARLIINEQLHYATLYSLAGYLIDEINPKGHDCIQALIPHDYIEGPQHGRQEKGGFCWDMQTDAAGQEQQLDELNNRWHNYTHQRWLELSQAFKRAEPAVYSLDKHEEGEQHRDYIFTNEATLKQIRWKHFLADCEPLLADTTALLKRADQETATAETWLRQTHADIMENFDPKIVKLKKKMKVVIAPGALDGLVDEDRSDG